MSRVPIHRLLLGLVLFDATIAVVAFFFPQLWYTLFHGATYVDPQGLLRRTAASWAGFALCQAIALRKWKRDPAWLMLVAGIRLSDVFTDWTYLYFCKKATWFAYLGLSLTSPANAWIGYFLIGAYAREKAKTLS